MKKNKYLHLFLIISPLLVFAAVFSFLVIDWKAEAQSTGMTSSVNNTFSATGTTDSTNQMPTTSTTSGVVSTTTPTPTPTSTSSTPTTTATTPPAPTPTTATVSNPTTTTTTNTATTAAGSTTTSKSEQEQNKTTASQSQNENKTWIEASVTLTDTDHDGIVDVDEIRMGTDPKRADSDNDGVFDGEELLRKTNPLQRPAKEGDDNIQFESVKEKGEISREQKVAEVKMIQKEERKKLSLAGKGIPNSYVTVYIYSDKPIIVTVKTDGDGNWSYEMDSDSLENGEHEVYVAVTDATGKVKTKSETFRFVKTAEAATALAFGEKKEPVAINASPVENAKTSMFYLGLFLSVSFLVISLLIIGYFVIVRKKDEGID